MLPADAVEDTLALQFPTVFASRSGSACPELAAQAASRLAQQLVDARRLAKLGARGTTAAWHEAAIYAVLGGNDRWLLGSQAVSHVVSSWRDALWVIARCALQRETVRIAATVRAAQRHNGAHVPSVDGLTDLSVASLSP